MKFVKLLWPYLLLLAIGLLFFHKTVFFGLLPFPGDLLMSEYNPWRHASYGGYGPGAMPSKVQYFDVIRELYPWKWLAIDEIKRGRLPFWNAYNFCGTPLLANYQSAILYPLNVLYLLLPFDIAWSALVVLQPILGAVFFYLFATTIGVSSWGAVIGAIAFNYGSFANVWMEFNTVWHTILWLPLILWCIEKRKMILLAFAVFASATAGHPQDFLYIFGFSVLYAAARVFTKKPYETSQGVILSKTAFGFLSGLGLAAPQLLPTIELFSKSARVPHDYEFIVKNMLIQSWHIMKLFIPDFFGNPATKTYLLNDTYVNTALGIGFVGITLAIVSAATRDSSWHRKFFLMAAAAILILTVRSPVTEILYRFPIPILSTGSPTRVFSLLAMSLAALAAMGWDKLSQQPKKRILVLGVAAAALSLAWISALLLGAPTSFRATLLATVVFAFLSTALFMAPIRFRAGMIAAILIFELLIAFMKFNPFVPRSLIYPPHPLWDFLRSRDPLDRFWGYGTASILPNISIMYRLQSPDGIDPLNLKPYNQFIQGSNNGMLARAFTRITRSDAGIAPGFGKEDLANNQTRLRIMDALGIRFVIDRIENAATAITFPPERFVPVWKQDGWTIFENTQAAPRYFLTEDARPYRTAEDFETQFFSASFNPGKTVLIDSKYSLPAMMKDSAKEIKLLGYTPTNAVFETNTQTPQLLYLSDADDGNWRATIDGKQTPILRANWAFRATLVPDGRHTVIFSYYPHSFLLGTGIFAITLAGLLLLIPIRQKIVKLRIEMTKAHRSK